MAEQLRTIVLVSIVALALWLFAEAESLGEHSALSSVRFVAGEAQDRWVRAAEEFDGAIKVDIVGSRSAIARAESELSRGIDFSPGMTGVPTADGRHTVNLLETLRAHDPLEQTGVTVLSVTPLFVDIEVIELVRHELPIEPALGPVAAVGPVKVTPEKASVRLPKSAIVSLGDRLKLTARLSTDQSARLPLAGAVRESVRVEAPSEAIMLPGFEVSPASAVLEFTVRARAVTERIRSVPVQVVLPPIEVGKWNVEIAAEDRFLDAEVTGAPEQIEKLKGADEALVAVVSLSTDELEAGVDAKDATFLFLRGGVITPRSDLQVASSDARVVLSISRRPEAEVKP